MRGEDELEPAGRVVDLGSPPHARGRRREERRIGTGDRITPACAGKTINNVSSSGSGRDHPRMRGEDTNACCAFRSTIGSPPHARGRLGPELLDNAKWGITPACAGKTTTGSSVIKSPQDHPRMRGEDCRQVSVYHGFGGSPPHARGRLLVLLVEGAVLGITPACAGKTRAASAIFRPRTDHPRMRGEDGTNTALPANPSGSPPHARGRRRDPRRDRCPGGITPACAGKTQGRR